MAQNFKQPGRVIDALGSECTCPALNNKPTAGDPVVIGTGLAGVAETTAAATTDTVPVNTMGVYNIPVSGTNNAGNIAVAKGDKLFIKPATAVVSKDSVTAGQIPYGIALGPVNSGAVASIDVRLGVN
jgi:predicted RecA/RadA family phage recombinase